MAYLVNNGAGATFSTAANWDTVTNTPALHTSTNVSIGTSSYYGATFTAPNTSNYATGVLVYIDSNSATAGTVTAYLQENSAGWVDKANSPSISATAFNQYNFYYFRFNTPYQFTSTTANYYRIKFTGVGRSGTLNFGSASTSTSIPAFLATDDRHTAPTIANDDIFVVGANGTTKTITVDGTSNGVGTGASTGSVIDNYYSTTADACESRKITNAIQIGKDGILDFDNTTNTTLTVRGNIHIDTDGLFKMDGSSDQTKLLNLVFDHTGCSTSTGGYGMGKIRGGYVYLKGAPKSSTSLWKTTIASGTGTAADPVIMTDAVDWIVGDKIIIPASSDRATNYNETENRYIITKNSSTSYVWSDTPGGSELAITSAYHTLTTYALNITRNVLISSINGSTLIGSYYIGHDIVTSTLVAEWFEWRDLGSVSSAGAGSGVLIDKYGFTSGMNSDAVLDMKYPVFSNVLFRSLTMNGPCISGYDTIGMINCNSGNNYGGSGLVFFGGKSQTHTDAWWINLENGPMYNSSQSCTFTRCFCICVNKRDQFNRGGFVEYSAINNRFYDCEAHCNNRSGFTTWGSTFSEYYDCQSGTKGTNHPYQVIANGSGTLTGFAYFHNTLYDRFMTPDTTPVTAFGFGPYMLTGSEIRFNDYNGVVGDNYWFKREGSARTTTDNARTAGSKCVELSPLDSTNGFNYNFLILARANTAVQALGFIKKHTIDIASVVTVNLYLPGSNTPDFTQTMPDDDNWNPFVVYANYTGSVDLFAKVEILVKATSGVCLVDDIFNGTNNITALDASYQAKPSPVMFEQLGDAAAVWAVPTNILTTAGTTGKKLVDDLELGDFLATK